MGIWGKAVLIVFFSVLLLGTTATTPSLAQVTPDVAITKDANPIDIQLLGQGDPEDTTVTITVEGFGSTSLVDAKTDFILVLDESGSLTNTQFAQLKDFAVSFVNSLTIGADDSQVGITMFATNARNIINLSGDQASIINAINGITKLGGNTCIGCGLFFADTMFQNFGRADAIPIVLVLTDGVNTRPAPASSAAANLASAINALETRGVIRIAIGVGNNVNQNEINAIASDPDSQFAFLGIDFNTLSTLVDTIITQVQISSAPTSVNLVETTLDYIVNHASINPAPDSQTTLPSGQLQLTWSDLGSKVGNNDGILESGEIFTATFVVNSNLGGNNLPVNDLDITKSNVNYVDPVGIGQTTALPQAFINVNGPPVADAGPDQTVECASPSGTVVTLDGTGSSDPNGDTLTFTWTDSFGTVTGSTPSVTLSLGSSVITLTVSDGLLTDTDTVVVTVLDTTLPDITAPAGFMVFANTDGGWTGDIGQAIATDTCDADVDITNDAPTVFPLGDTIVTWTATDDAGNQATETQTINVKPLSVDIDIKPNSDPNSINTKSKGTIPVAILSTPDFDATEVDKTSLTFGKTGDEDSLKKCTKSNEDVNGDGLLDVVCHFNTQDTGFLQVDTEGILKGQTVDGTPIEGRDSVRIVK